MTLAALHPQVAHFTIALAIIGALFRVISLLGRPAWVSPAATTLLLLAALSAFVSNQSGDAAHGPVERMPGARPAVQEHEEWGHRTQIGLFALAVIEIVGLAMLKSPKVKMVNGVAAIVSLICVGLVYETGEHGGQIVYGYAGGVGIRSGDPADVERLLLAGLYNGAQAERKAGRAQEAAKLMALAGERHPSDAEVQLAAAESLLLDRKDAPGAIEKLRAIQPPHENRSLRIRHGLLTADALEASGQKDGAAAVVQALLTEYPDVARLRQRLETLK